MFLHHLRGRSHSIVQWLNLLRSLFSSNHTFGRKYGHAVIGTYEF